ncbi:hypothetical protein ARALYDRAFT_899310 [Arabidopsis lyrata subsp. lyrata]|uniref:Uncharacterized protein n=1 Tax=Arabidopsis lyrata subsp. lyrata TaxID=81972 RepID=D7L8K9_ARALL|nr:uncharacterized protein LOC9321848 [Arabidopsis lyrata subsp. lyrata]EFH62041.1 hypothetical protein ARALYDRAFT_899310 [Arabidopsis lyrata subsp. lyrata]|eukprot:XP_002885782.1 uncharacterized protein LOC9321848 [Arabidopsis lyrata subsp. lyrata]
MDRFPFLNVVMEGLGILHETRKLFLKNKKMSMMFSVLVFPFLLNCLVFLFNQTFVGFSYIFMAVFPIINLYSDLVTVHASALTLKNENIKIKYFPVMTFKSWKGPLVTKFYIALFILGYGFLYAIIFCPLLVFSSKLFFLVAKSVPLLILLEVYESYLAIVWNLSMVISILEETYGIKALRKAAKIAKGMKPKIFLLNLSFHLLTFGLGQILQLINWRRSFSVTLATGLVFVCLDFALRMFQLVTYTVVYFQCKSLQSKDVESLGDVEYTKLSSNTVMG